MAGRISCLDNEARQGRNREGEERTKRRRRRKVVSLVRRTTQHPFWPGWSPVNLLFMPLSAQISSNDVLGPSSSPFSLLFFPFPFLFLFSFPPPPPPPRLSTFLHVAHVTGLLSSPLERGKGEDASKVNEKKDRRARPAAFPNPILRFHGPPRKSLPSSPPPPPPIRASLLRFHAVVACFSVLYVFT